MIIITGQTATGKTALALKLAKKYNGELVNFDSRQIYKYLDIITGKDILPTKIWLYDIVKPNEYFSSFDYTKKARKVIQDIIKRGKTPILVGGTYFYLKHLLYGFDIAHVPANHVLREKLNNQSVSKLQEMLKKLDVQSFNRLNNSDKNNPRRLIRRIEIIKSGISQKNTSQSETMIKKIIPQQFIGIKYQKREDLIKAIKQRVAKRLKQGAVEEVASLLKKGYKATDPGLKTIGYQEIIRFLKGDISYEQAIEQWTNHEIQYAKRQYTFMKKDKNISWLLI